MSKLLNKDPKQRLGFKSGLEEIKEHPWVKEVDWHSLEQKKVLLS